MLLAKLFRELFLEFSFLWRKFRCKIFDAGVRSHVRSFVRWRLFTTHALPAVTFSRDGKSSRLTPIVSHSILSSTWPERDRTRRPIANQSIFRDNWRLLRISESAEPDFFSPKSVFFFFFFFEGEKRGSKGNLTPNVEDIYIFTKKESWFGSLDNIARSRSGRS